MRKIRLLQLRDPGKTVSVLPAVDHYRISVTVGRYRPEIQPCRNRLLCDQHVLCRFSGRGHLPGSVVPCNGEGQPENSNTCILPDLRSRSYRESVQRKRTRFRIVRHPDHFRCIGRSCACIDFSPRRLIDSVHCVSLGQQRTRCV